MSTPSAQQVEQAFQTVYNRPPTPKELQKWSNVDVGEGDTYKIQQLTYRLGTPYGKIDPQANQSPAPSNQPAPSDTPFASYSQPSGSFSSGSTPTYYASTSGTYAPVPVSGGDNRTFSTNYTPRVDQNGNVAAFVPGGMGYSPGAYANYTPSAPSQPGAPTQAFPGSSTISGVNVPAQANQGAYGNIPLNNQFVGAMTVGGGTGEGGVKFPTFTFDFAKEQADAYARLKPFYEKLLSFAGGRLDLAQRILDYTYQQGMRESRQEYEQSVQEQDLTFPQENEQMQTTQNARGILTSGFGNTERDRLKKSQGLRREAVDRALENRESRLVSQRGFGLEEKQRGFEEEKFGQERERRQESTELSKDKFSIKQAEYQSEMDKALRAEQKAIRESDRAFQIKLAKGEF